MTRFILYQRDDCHLCDLALAELAAARAPEFDSVFIDGDGALEARYGLPLTLAIIGGNPLRFRPYVDLYHEALKHFGQPELPVGVHSPGYVAATDQQAVGLAAFVINDLTLEGVI